ncbi:peptide/nickel transport system ATP-binding protein/oligopeptide transport system ATP-binding protein [Actinopolymorpha cephalotaxi]|uniref:Peptide/nickel transport system ATP-binding protein/oligopeptide transport system ATP-binding protein n=1 Tax=Actinopolymorpha cephalotaxi TaxID=504797 RepID=A0A1I2KFG2_9ACTN|nr:ABC transporter ATP-binding protein [Actinopolymorpha cephalotaxi]NYH81183.1 peptide/nickel transport system ATP-binding protein/oligopeptide transport system ATP-binding protein [Actinopolymorpha cephalotaxi]SFF65704.1 peptide/nickel transport system ATP-binding protein/oligopeptide transport system ATP-binding protein [Actinopolymorpha cephalotaxi]
MADPAAPLLEVDDLAVEFHTRDGVVRAVNGLSWKVNPGRTLAIVGESGSGKSVSVQAVMGLLQTPPARIVSGAIRLRGQDLLAMDRRRQRAVCGERVAMVFQDALAALNPVYSVGFQLAEALVVRRKLSRGDARRRAIELLDLVKVPNARQRVKEYPHQFSGGMRQRVMIAMALALEPEVLIADEPTTALDVTVQAQIMRLLAEIQAERQMALILITHDLGVVADVADDITVMYAGRAVEQAGVYDVFGTPSHPYTKALLRSIPRVDLLGQQLEVIAGRPPVLTDVPSGCAFHPRCQYAQEICHTERPALLEVSGTQRSACHFAREVVAGTADRADTTGTAGATDTAGAAGTVGTAGAAGGNGTGRTDG